MMESAYFNNRNFREYRYFYFAGDLAVLKREFPVALVSDGLGQILKKLVFK